MIMSFLSTFLLFSLGIKPIRVPNAVLYERIYIHLYIYAVYACMRVSMNLVYFNILIFLELSSQSF